MVVEGAVLAARWLNRRRVLAYARVTAVVFALAWLGWIVAGSGLKGRYVRPNYSVTLRRE